MKRLIILFGGIFLLIHIVYSQDNIVISVFRNKYGMLVNQYQNGSFKLKREHALTKVLGTDIYKLDGVLEKYNYVPQKIFDIDYESRSIVLNYKPVGNGADSLRLEVELPKVKSKKAIPFIIWIHGGGWHEGTPASLRDISKFFASKGYASFRIQYRLRGAAKTNKDQLDDIRDAVNFIKANSAKFNVDPNKYVYSGGSAGGQLALISGINDKECDAIIPMFAVYDIKGFYNFLISIGEQKNISKEINDFFYMDNKEEYVKFSPNDIEFDNIAPTLIIHGTGDSTAPYSFCDIFIDKLKDSDCEYKTMIFENYEHSFIGKQSSDVYEKVLLKILDFLESIVCRK